MAKAVRLTCPDSSDQSHRKRTKPAGQTPQVGHLDMLGGILKEVGNVYREMCAGQTDIADGTRLIYSRRS
jgi:hypothetical protein